MDGKSKAVPASCQSTWRTWVSSLTRETPNAPAGTSETQVLLIVKLHDERWMDLLAWTDPGGGVGVDSLQSDHPLMLKGQRSKLFRLSGSVFDLFKVSPESMSDWGGGVSKRCQIPRLGSWLVIISLLVGGGGGSRLKLRRGWRWRWRQDEGISRAHAGYKYKNSTKANLTAF